MSIFKIISKLLDIKDFPKETARAMSMELVLEGLNLILPNKRSNRVCSIHTLKGNVLQLRSTTSRIRRNMAYGKDISNGAIGRAILGDHSILYLNDVGEAGDYLLGGGTKSEIVVPVKRNNRIIGVINIESESENDFSVSKEISSDLIGFLEISSKTMFDNMEENVQAEEKNIFLSYAKEDVEKVRSLKNELYEEGYNSWLDEEDLEAGVDWDHEIREKIKSADVILVCLSKHSVNKKGYVQKELKWAIDILDQTPEGKVSLIPVMLEECNIPSKVAHRQAVKLYVEGGFEKLVEGVRRALS